MARRHRPRPCRWNGWPHSLTYARPYPCGWRCDRHSPWGLAGQSHWIVPITPKEGS